MRQLWFSLGLVPVCLIRRLQPPCTRLVAEPVDLPASRGHVRSRHRELKLPAEALLQPCCRFSPTLPGPVDLPLADLLGDALRNPDDPGLVSGSLRPP